jgi:hypothetical protein
MTRAVIGALRVNLGLNSANFSRDLKQSQTGLDKFARVGAEKAVAAKGFSR